MSDTATIEALLQRVRSLEAQVAAERTTRKALEEKVKALLDHAEDEYDIAENGGPNWAMRLMDGHGGVLALALDASRRLP